MSSVLCVCAVVYRPVALAAMRIFWLLERQWQSALPVGRNNFTSGSWSSVSWEMNNWVFFSAVILEELPCPCSPEFVPLISFTLKNWRKGKHCSGTKVGFGTFLMTFLQWAAAACYEDFLISTFSTSKRLTVEIEEVCTKPWTHSNLCAELLNNLLKFSRTSLFLKFSPPGFWVIAEMLCCTQ